MYYSGFSNRNLLIAVTYDEIGNPLSYRDSYQFTWQNGRRLATVSHGSDSISYTYNPDGIRTSKTVSGAVTKFHTMNSTLLGQTKGSDTIVFLYDEKGNKYGFDYNGTKYYYIFNVQGDVIGILNQAGQKIVSYTYDPWGKVLSVDGSEASTIGQFNPIRYRGYYYDTETGFYYLQSRYYDPEVRRWINSDGYISSIGGDIRGYNMFAYCMNNPVTLSDNTGNWPFFAVTAVIGAVVGAVVGGVVAANNGGNIWVGIGIGAAAGALIGTGFGMGAGAALAGSITASTGAVMAGGSALLGTVATGGLGAGVTYVANNLSQAVNNTAPIVQAGASKMQQVAAKGKAGEIASGLVKNTQRIYITPIKYRIPDGLDTTNKILSEVKNYSGTLSYISQLRDFVSWSQANGYQMHLYTNARLTGPLQQAVDSGLIQLFPLE